MLFTTCSQLSNNKCIRLFYKSPLSRHASDSFHFDYYITFLDNIQLVLLIKSYTLLLSKIA